MPAHSIQRLGHGERETISPGFDKNANRAGDSQTAQSRNAAANTLINANQFYLFIDRRLNYRSFAAIQGIAYEGGERDRGFTAFQPIRLFEFGYAYGTLSRSKQLLLDFQRHDHPFV